ncbi:prion-inhibition and propagation-domain-containing protein [Xylaria palmicola]|nr:prion-inhibition and propagation-domain-containing protein [Xylaria palmicola]
MAEAVGTIASVITLIGLLKGCIDACELIRAAKDYRDELERYDLKLALEQCRLKTWGKSRHLLEHFEFRYVIEEALQQIINLLTNSDRLSKKYGAQKMSTELTASPGAGAWRSTSVLQFTTAFKRLRIHDTIRNQVSEAMASSVWVFYDQKKYASLIEELRTLVDAVEKVTRDLVTREQQQQLFISRINAISDVRTLNLLTKVCEDDHPAFSDAASVRAEVISFTTTRKADLSDWVDNATNDLDEPQKEVTDDMENWDLTDFRRQYLALLNVAAARSRTESGMGEFSEDQSSGSGGDDNDHNVGEDGKNVETTAKPTGKDTSSTGLFSENDLKRGGPVEFNHAIAYINKIKKRFSQRPEVYRQFLETLQTYQRESMPLQEVYAKVIDLLGPETDLVEDFKFFLPASVNQTGKHAQLPESQLKGHTKGSTAEIDLKMQLLVSVGLGNSEDASTLEPPQMNTKRTMIRDDALRYLDTVEAHSVQAPGTYNMFLDIMKDYKSHAIDTSEVIYRAKSLFAGHEVLIRGFERFLPPGYSMADDSGKSTTKTLPTFLRVEPLHVSSTSAANGGAEVVNTMVPDTAPLLEITMGLDMKDAETLRYYSELSMYKYGTWRDTLAFSPHLGPESRDRVVDIAERFGLSHDKIILEDNTVQLIVRRSHPDSDDVYGSDSANVNNAAADDKDINDSDDEATVEESTEMI